MGLFSTCVDNATGHTGTHSFVHLRASVARQIQTVGVDWIVIEHIRFSFGHHEHKALGKSKTGRDIKNFGHSSF